MDLPIYKLVIDESEDSGVTAIALVDKPAIELNWHMFSKQQKFKAEYKRRIISGPLMVADLPIYRNDSQYGEHYVMFTKETIEKIVYKFAKQSDNKAVNKMHQESLTADGVFLFESFIIDKERGILTPKGHEELPDGSWFGSMKVDNDEIWNEFINSGVYRGFSVEGYFKPQPLTEDEALMREVLAHLEK